MTKDSIFEYSDYKKWVTYILGEKKRGARSKLAQAMGCHLAYISQVLEGFAHFTLEQAAELNNHFGHTDVEADYFFQLVHLSRAGTPALKKYYENKLMQIKEFQDQFISRIEIKKKLSLKDEVQYYSSWYYIAAYVFVSIPGYQTKEKIAEKLGLSLKKTAEILEFLAKIGMIKKEKNHFFISATRLHLPANSPLILKHHTNWRLRALSSLERLEKSDDSHYSTVYSLSLHDIRQIKKKILKLVEDIEPIVKKTDPERAYCLSFDFFEV